LELAEVAGICSCGCLEKKRARRLLGVSFGNELEAERENYHKRASGRELEKGGKRRRRSSGWKKCQDKEQTI